MATHAKASAHAANKGARPPTKYRRALGASEGNGVQGNILVEMMHKENAFNIFLSQEHHPPNAGLSNKGRCAHLQ